MDMHEKLLSALELGKKVHGNYAGLSRASGVSEANISRWRKGQSPRISEYAPLLQALHAQLVFPGDELIEYELIPKTSARAGAGSSFLTEDEVEGLYAFRKDFMAQLKISKDAVLLDVIGDSMEPTLRNGDTILVDKQDKEVHEGKIYLVSFQEQLLIKRLFHSVNGLILRSDNAMYIDTTVPPEYMDDLIVWGRMRWLARTF